MPNTPPRNEQNDYIQSLAKIRYYTFKLLKKKIQTHL